MAFCMFRVETMGVRLIRLWVQMALQSAAMAMAETSFVLNQTERTWKSSPRAFGIRSTSNSTLTGACFVSITILMPGAPIDCCTLFSLETMATNLYMDRAAIILSKPGKESFLE